MSEDIKLISNYNHEGGFGNLGKNIFVELVHEMRDVSDVIEFVLSSKCISGIIEDELFKWGISPSLTRMYCLKDVPSEKIDVVCIIDDF